MNLHGSSEPRHHCISVGFVHNPPEITVNAYGHRLSAIFRALSCKRSTISHFRVPCGQGNPETLGPNVGLTRVRDPAILYLPSGATSDVASATRSADRGRIGVAIQWRGVMPRRQHGLHAHV
jgi:hypothetical protein